MQNPNPEAFRKKSLPVGALQAVFGVKGLSGLQAPLKLGICVLNDGKTA
jgi:hypothetical protein